MEIEKLRTLLEAVKSEEGAVDDALQSLRTLPFEDLGFSKIDHHRQLRTGFPEVIFCQGKTVEHVKQISERILSAGLPLLPARVAPERLRPPYPGARPHFPPASARQPSKTADRNGRPPRRPRAHRGRRREHVARSPCCGTVRTYTQNKG